MQAAGDPDGGKEVEVMLLEEDEVISRATPAGCRQLSGYGSSDAIHIMAATP